MTFAQSRLTLDCRKFFRADMEDSDFIDRSIVGKWYGEPDGLHTVYVVEIEKVYVSDNA